MVQLSAARSIQSMPRRSFSGLKAASWLPLMSNLRKRLGALDVPNGETVYSTYWGMDRMTETHEVDASIAISVDGKDVATVHCTPGSARQALESIDLRPSN